MNDIYFEKRNTCRYCKNHYSLEQSRPKSYCTNCGATDNWLTIQMYKGGWSDCAQRHVYEIYHGKKCDYCGALSHQKPCKGCGAS